MRSNYAGALEQFRHRLSYDDALPQLICLGVIAGIASSLLVVAFRFTVEGPLSQWFLAGNADFEMLSAAMRFLLPFCGALLLGIGLHFVDPRHRSVSISHVLERLHNHQGRLPLQNLILQFFGGALSLLSGQSVGKEGPGVHLGSGFASLLGQWFRLPDNSLRTLIGCGAAAAISASFNTPMAGVIFAMEVILMEYTIVGFIPVIIASVLGATISMLVFDAEIAMAVTSPEVDILWELPFMTAAGLVFSVAAGSFIWLHLKASAFTRWPVIPRFAVIGALTGLVAIWVPQILGLGYDTLNAVSLGQVALHVLVLIVVAKLVVTAVVTGLGMLGGFIGPSLVIGGCLGAILGIAGNALVPEASNPDFYVALGMVAMMGAVLNAPLAAMVAILELSNSPGIIFPSMLMVVVSCLGVRLIFRYEGIFAEQLKLQGHSIVVNTGRSFLARVGIQSTMNRSFLVLNETIISIDVAQTLLANKKIWLLVCGGEGSEFLLSTADLANHLLSLENSDQDSKAESAAAVDLAEIPGNRLGFLRVDSRISLLEADRIIELEQARSLVVCGSVGNTLLEPIGVVTADSIRNFRGV